MQVNNASANQKNIHAILQHRRLWHVGGVCIRNLRTSQQEEKALSVGSQLTLSVVSSRKIFFRITSSNNQSSGEDGNVVYESEHIVYCTNPSWLGFLMPKNKQTVGTLLSLELWVEDNLNGDNMKILNWDWNLSRLHYIAERLYHGEISFASNALILQISGSFYSLSECFSTDAPHGNCPHYNLDEEKASCNVFSLQRMITSKKSISLSKQRAKKNTETCEQLLREQEARSMKKKQIEDLKSRILILKLLLTREASMLKAAKDNFADLQSSTKANKEKMGEERDSAMQERDRYNEVTEQLVISRQRTDVLRGQLSYRRIEVLSELAYIFPILPYTPPSGSKTSKNQKQSPKLAPNFMICGIYLPEAESLGAKDDAKNAVAMGYVSQMLYMISYFLLIPVRYPIMLQGSQSSILDNVLDTIQEKERVFPLFVKTNKERYLFEYGVYLLNRNIGQLRYLLGIPTQDLRPTLYNLKTLLEHAISIQQGKDMHMARSSTVSLPKPPRTESKSPKPRKKTSSSPKPVLKSTPIPNAVDLNMLDPEMNGIAKSPLGLQEKVHDRSQELNSLRGELFGNRKSSKPIPVSPHRSASPSTSRKLANSSPSRSSLIAPTFPSQESSKVTESLDVNATFLTGLEDLEQGQKTEKGSQKPLDIAAARNELFKTKSGRSVMTKKQTYMMRTSRAGSGHPENYIATKEQVFKISDLSASPMSNGIDEACDQSRTENGTTENGEGPFRSDDEGSNSNIQELTPLLTPADEDIDLC